MNAALSVRDLTVAYSEKPVLWDIDLDIPSGSRTAIVGPNGAGKSTLIKAVLGLIPVAAGTIRVFDQPVDQARQRIGWVPQRSHVDWDFPADVLDVVMMGRYGRLGWFKRPGKRDREIALDALDQVSMADLQKRHISQLSVGQQQRVFLARALAQQADLYLMDEPFAGVDAVTEEAIVQILRRLQADGKTSVVVHHDLDTAQEYFDHAVLLNIRLTNSGPMSEVWNQQSLEAAYGHRAAQLFS